MRCGPGFRFHFQNEATLEGRSQVVAFLEAVSNASDEICAIERPRDLKEFLVSFSHYNLEGGAELFQL